MGSIVKTIADIPSMIKGSFSKLAKLREIIKLNGGIRNSLWKMYINDDLKDGCLRGEDKYGNKYYENNRYFYPRNRWVEYADYQRLEYDGSMVPAEWNGWLHNKTDEVPCADPNRPQYCWMADHVPNMSGTPGQFYPYSTTRPKIEVWQPPKTKSTCCQPQPKCGE